MRPKLFIDREPNTFAKMRDLFSPVNRLKVRYDKPDERYTPNQEQAEKGREQEKLATWRTA